MQIEFIEGDFCLIKLHQALRSARRKLIRLIQKRDGIVIMHTAE